MQQNRLFVGNLAYSVTEAALRDLFSQVGQVVSCALISDKFSGQSKGFAFVEMGTDDLAKEAITKFDGFEMDGRKIIVNVARPKEDRGPRDNFRSGGGSGGNRGYSKGPKRY